MPIISTDIQYRLSGGAANSNPNASLGGAKSSEAMPTGLFDAASSAEAAAGLVEYRCIYIHNAHGTLTAIGPRIWLQANTPSATTTIDIGIGTSAQGGTEQTVGAEATAPSGVTFSAPTDYAGGIALGDIPAGGHRAVWLRRTVNAGTTATTDTATLRTQCDTAP